VAPRIFFGVNLNFAKYVYGRKRAIEVVRRKLGLRHVEMVADNDFGPVLYLRAPEAFRDYHYQVADHAALQGVQIPSVFTVYRDTGAIASGHPDIRESAYQVGLAMIEQAACYRARYVGAALFTMNQEEADDPESYQALFYSSLDTWKRWMGEAQRLGIQRLLIETTAAYREGCSTIDDTQAALQLLDEYHQKNPDTTTPVGICYDTGHGISPSESRDEANRSYRAWLEAFPSRIHSIHLKNTDPEFIETWHFHGREGIIDPHEVLRSVRDCLTVPEVHVFLEVPGKRGREIGERRALEEHVASIETIHDALRELGYTEDERDFGWTPR
jgi:sugar phosphate isomerase/epimerase